MGRGYAWLDAGTSESMLDAWQFVAAIEKRQGLKVACLEEIALKQGWIGIEHVQQQARAMSKSAYGQYLQRVVDEVAAAVP